MRQLLFIMEVFVLVASAILLTEITAVHQYDSYFTSAATNRFLLTKKRGRQKRVAIEGYPTKLAPVDSSYHMIHRFPRKRGPRYQEIYNITNLYDFSPQYVSKQCSNSGHNAARDILSTGEKMSTHPSPSWGP